MICRMPPMLVNRLLTVLVVEVVQGHALYLHPLFFAGLKWQLLYIHPRFLGCAPSAHLLVQSPMVTDQGVNVVVLSTSSADKMAKRGNPLGLTPDSMLVGLRAPIPGRRLVWPRRR